MDQPLRKNLGKKNCEFNDEHIQRIADLITYPQETKKSKIFPNKAFGYWKITVERPLRLVTDLSAKKLTVFAKICEDEPLNDWRSAARKATRVKSAF